MINFITGDCIRHMQTMELESVHAIIADPPYGMNYQSDYGAEKKTKIANDERPFIWWIAEAYRILKDSSPLLCFCNWKNSESFRFAIELAGFKIVSQLVWDRETHGMGSLTSYPGQRHDIIWYATKGRYEFPGSRPVSIIRSLAVNSKHLIHPNQKPVDLLSRLLFQYVLPGSIVFDPFCGIGSLGIACNELQLGYQYTGIDINSEYITLAKKAIPNG